MQGKVVAITGASQGIGAAAARVFAKAGAKVVVLARNKTALTALATELGENTMALPCDVADYAQVEAAVAAIHSRFGALDVWIGNAGMIEPIARLAEADPAQWAKAIAVNLTGVFNGMRAVLPQMKRGGTIITISSGAAHNALEGWSAYCASKAGAAMLTRSAHLEEVARGIRIMGLSPGTVATDMQVAIRQSGINPVSQLDPSVHIPADWPARCLLWMCSPDADQWLGQEVQLRDEKIRRAVGLIA